MFSDLNITPVLAAVINEQIQTAHPDTDKPERGRVDARPALKDQQASS